MGKFSLAISFTARAILATVLLLCWTPLSAQIDNVGERRLLMLGIDHPLLVDFESNIPAAYRLTFPKELAIALRDAKLGFDGATYLLVPTPSDLGKSGKVNASIVFNGDRTPWRANLLLSLGNKIPLRKRNDIAFTVIHTGEAQYMIGENPAAGSSLLVIETLGLSHLATGSVLHTKANKLVSESDVANMVFLTDQAGKKQQAYIRKIYRLPF